MRTFHTKQTKHTKRTKKILHRRPRRIHRLPTLAAKTCTRQAEPQRPANETGGWKIDDCTIQNRGMATKMHRTPSAAPPQPKMEIGRLTVQFATREMGFLCFSIELVVVYQTKFFDPEQLATSNFGWRLVPVCDLLLVY